MKSRAAEAHGMLPFLSQKEQNHERQPPGASCHKTSHQATLPGRTAWELGAASGHAGRNGHGHCVGKKLPTAEAGQQASGDSSPGQPSETNEPVGSKRGDHLAPVFSAVCAAVAD